MVWSTRRSHGHPVQKKESSNVRNGRERSEIKKEENLVNIMDQSVHLSEPRLGELVLKIITHCPHHMVPSSHIGLSIYIDSHQIVDYQAEKDSIYFLFFFELTTNSVVANGEGSLKCH